MFAKIAACASAGIVIVVGVQFAEAKTQTIKDPQVTVGAGSKISIRDLYAWDAKCRTLNVDFKPVAAPTGRLYTVNDRFRVKTVANDPCNGKSISGKRVMFEPNQGFTGKTIVSYRVKTPNYPDSFIFTLPIKVR